MYIYICIFFLKFPIDDDLPSVSGLETCEYEQEEDQSATVDALLSDDSDLPEDLNLMSAINIDPASVNAATDLLSTAMEGESTSNFLSEFSDVVSADY